MSVLTKKKGAISSVGKSWVIDLPDDFAQENDLKAGTQVLITFKGSDTVTAEVMPPLSDKLAVSAHKILKKRIGAYEELRSIGD